METNIKPLQTDIELNNLELLARKVLHLPGNFVEVGLWEGGSALRILKTIQDRNLYLYDSFEGFRDLRDDEENLKGIFTDFTHIEDGVRGLFKNAPNVGVFRTHFPDNATVDTIVFAHIDVDSYQATLNALNYIYPRMVEGGIIVLHDYIQPELKVKDAIDFFAHEHGEIVSVLQNSSQAIIIK